MRLNGGGPGGSLGSGSSFGRWESEECVCVCERVRVRVREISLEFSICMYTRESQPQLAIKGAP